MVDYNRFCYITREIQTPSGEKVTFRWGKKERETRLAYRQYKKGERDVLEGLPSLEEGIYKVRVIFRSRFDLVYRTNSFRKEIEVGGEEGRLKIKGQ